MLAAAAVKEKLPSPPPRQSSRGEAHQGAAFHGRARHEGSMLAHSRRLLRTASGLSTSAGAVLLKGEAIVTGGAVLAVR